MKRTLTTLILIAVSLGSQPAVAGTTGAVRGTVVDVQTAEPLAGVTVIATSPALQGEEATLTDDLGRYTITGLPPGAYQLRFEFAGATTDRGNVGVSIDKTITVNVQLSSAAAKGEVYTIEEAAPSVDVASTTLGMTITKEYLDNVPQGRDRNFDGALGVLPSATGDQYGTSVSGATSVENSYVVDGLNTTDPAYGLMGSRLILDFIEEFELKEGGYGAEYGRATGGFVNVVTKSGSNEFHGSVFVYYRPGFLEARRTSVFRPGEALAARRELGYYLNAGFELGGPIIKDKLWFHVGYAPELQSDLWYRDIMAMKPGPDTDGNGRPDTAQVDEYGTPVMAKVQTNKYDSLGVVHQFRAKLTHAIDSNNRHSLTISGAPSRFDGARQNDFDPNTPTRGMNRDPAFFQFEDDAGNVDSVYRYAGKFMNDKLQLEGWLGWHYQESVYGPSTERGRDLPMINSQYPRNLRDVQAQEVGLPAECAEGQDFDDGSRCIVDDYMRGGFGYAEYSYLNRFAEKAAATHLFDFAGLHQVKYGIDFEQNRYYDRRYYTGRAYYNQRIRAAEQFRSQEFFRQQSGCDPFSPFPDEGGCAMAEQLAGRSGSQNYSLFLQDSWNPMPTFTVNYGVRWEAQQFLGTQLDDPKALETKFAIMDNWAPRIGAMWDFLGNGRSKAFVHWGRFYESIPLDLANRGFAGEGLRFSYFDANGDYSGQRCTTDGDPASPEITADQVTDPAVQCPNFTESIPLGGEDTLVAPGLKGQYSDETIAGVEVEVIPSWVIGLTGIYRSLGNVIEDVSTDGGNTYMIANPGQFDNNILDDLDVQISREKDPVERAKLQTFRDQASAINNFPRATRQFFGLQFQLDKKLAQHFLLRGSYLLSWTHGNYPGLYSDNNLQLDPNVTSQYDLPGLVTNRTGYLPSDRRHRIKVSGFYQAGLEDFGVKMPMAFTLGASGRVTSGKPIEVLGSDPGYGTSEGFLLPRGVGGRTPWVWSADVHLGARYNFDKTMGAELFIDLFNVTNNQETTEVDQDYTYDDILPIKNGTVEDLPYATNTSGAPVTKNQNYKNATQYQAPFSGQLGVRVFF